MKRILGCWRTRTGRNALRRTNEAPKPIYSMSVPDCHSMVIVVRELTFPMMAHKAENKKNAGDDVIKSIVAMLPINPNIKSNRFR